MYSKDSHVHRSPKTHALENEPRDDAGHLSYLAQRDMRPEIHLHEGFMRLYICGGVGQPKAWFPVTAPSSAQEPHGLPEEREIAEKTVAWLRLHHSQNTDLDPATIRQALKRHGWKPDPLTRYPE